MKSQSQPGGISRKYLFYSLPLLPSEQTIKLIFSDGLITGQQLTQEALTVCQLLAINPNDVLVKDIEEFKVPGFTQ